MNFPVEYINWIEDFDAEYINWGIFYRNLIYSMNIMNDYQNVILEMHEVLLNGSLTMNSSRDIDFGKNLFCIIHILSLLKNSIEDFSAKHPEETFQFHLLNNFFYAFDFMLQLASKTV